MSFLTGFLASVTEKFLAFFWDKLSSFLGERKRINEAKAASEAASAAVLVKTQAAQTQSEREDAAKNTIGHF